MATRSGNRPATKNNSKRKAIPGMDQLQEWVDLARYEIEVDPYRGLQEILDGESKVRSPWRLSCVPDLAAAGTTSPTNPRKDRPTIQDYKTNIDVLDIESSDDDELLGICGGPQTDEQAQEEETLVVSATRCKCPSLLHWTREASKKNQRKRRKNDQTPMCIACRPKESLDYRCACDYNPFCLWSLGGVLDDVLLPADVSDEVELATDWENPKAGVYSSATQEMYKRVRRSTLVNVEPIRDYLDEMVDEADEAIDRLEAKHSPLYFINPLVKNNLRKDPRPAKIRMALPPGIENLGATCYLNTQLQCLAQNRVFLQGILSWKCTANDRMSTVLRLFQNLLAQMHFGPYNTVNTLDFSNALGLDHHEQQDPNEFSRLFLERMHESFQGSNLDELLPLIFRGENTFETVCQKCKSKSVRKEHFMDLNLPIVKKKSFGTSGSVLDFVKPKRKNVDLEDCLIEYSRAEHLNGDNQYYCTHCQSKQDAIRHLKLTSLPSVLNLQLVRYVYNRQTGMKKKVTTAVALPHFTKLGEQRYRLCAIMSHQGASAYSGHYTAEAMDWESGQWYSFNDESVHFLPDGPKSSYCGGDSEECEASTDAYNLYYVAENFLTQSIMDGVQRPIHKISLAHQISRERCDLFEQLSVMCSADAEAAERLTKRRCLIKRELASPSIRSLFWSLPQQDMVWVDTTFLIRFLSCSDGLQSVLKHSYFTDVSSLLCEHKKLHPRVARKGKFIPRSVIEHISKCIQQEEAFSDVDNRDTIHPILISAGEVVCKDCSSVYKENLAKKLSRVERIMKLRTALEPSNLSSAFPLVSSHHDITENEYAYVISRRFATWFRSVVGDFAKKSLKDASSAERLSCDVSLVRIKAENAAEGMDGLDPSRFIDSSNGMEEVARKVNGPIICKHEQFNATKKTSYFVIPGTLWNQIKILFPNGVELKFRNDSDSSSDEIPTLTNPFCLACFEERDLPEDLSDSIDEVSPKSLPSLAADIEDNEVMVVDPPSKIFDLRVFEASQGSTPEDIRQSLMLVSGTDQQPASVEHFLRRSSRKRKLRFPLGCFLDEETCRIDLSQNIASLRLSLLEKCSAGSNFQLDHTVYLIITKSPKGETNAQIFLQDDTTSFQQLDYAKNAETLKAVCENAVSASFSDAFDPTSSLTLVRIAEREPTISPEISKEEILDHFISLAHGSSEQKKRKRATRTERGFNGTFLLSADSGLNDQERPETNEPNVGDTSMQRAQSVLQDDVELLSAINASESLQKMEVGGQDYRLNTETRTNTKDAKANEVSETCIQVKENKNNFFLRSPNQPIPASSSPAIATLRGSVSVGIDRSLSPGANFALKQPLPEVSPRKRDNPDFGGSKHIAIGRDIPPKNNLEVDDVSVGTTELLESIVAALTTNPDISSEKQNPLMIRLAAEQVSRRIHSFGSNMTPKALQTNVKDLYKLIESAYQVYLELMTM